MVALIGFSQSLDEPHFHLLLSHCPDCSSLTKTLQLPSSLPSPPLPFSSPLFPFSCPSTSCSPPLVPSSEFSNIFHGHMCSKYFDLYCRPLSLQLLPILFFSFIFLFHFVRISSENISKRCHVPSTSLCPPRASLSLLSLP